MFFFPKVLFLYFILVTFHSILELSRKFGEISEVAAITRHHVIVMVLLRHMTSLLPVLDLKGNIFGRTIYPPSLIVRALILATLRGLGIRPRPRKQEKKRSMHRVKDTVRN